MKLISNHITTNLITKGWLNISAITKGMILPTFQYIIHVRRRGGGGDVYVHPDIRDGRHLSDDLKKLKEQEQEVDYIQVFVNWEHQPFKWGKNVTVELIKKKIEAQLLSEHHDKYNITVEFIK